MVPLFSLQMFCELEKLLPILKLIKNTPNISNLVNGSVYIYTEITIKVSYAMNYTLGNTHVLSLLLAHM